MGKMMRHLCLAAVAFVACGCTNSKNNLNGYLEFTGHKVVEYQAGSHRILIYSYGSAPLFLRKNCIKGNGLDGSASSGCTITRGYRFGSSEGHDIIIDYAALDRGVLVISQCVWDPRTSSRSPDDSVPFIKTTVTFSADGSYREKDEVVLAPEKGGQARMEQLRQSFLFNVAHADFVNSIDDVFEPVAHLRNIAIKDPDSVLAILNTIKTNHVDVSEELAEYKNQVARLKRVINGKR